MYGKCLIFLKRTSEPKSGVKQNSCLAIGEKDILILEAIDIYYDTGNRWLTFIVSRKGSYEDRVALSWNQQVTWRFHRYLIYDGHKMRYNSGVR